MISTTAMRLTVLLSFLTLAQGNGKNPVGTKPDPWVSAAPLIVGAVCRDGVALVAVHSKTDDDNDDENWLENYRDSVRIHPIDSEGTALLCAGWRTDAEWLSQKCRSISRTEIQTFGTPSSHLLAEEASLWMAQCASSDRVRALSVVGLLASGHVLHLVDATGAYRVRAAHAVGRGAKIVNARLRNVTFDDMTAEAGVDQLLQVLRQEGDDDEWQPLANETRVELAFVDSEKKHLQRIRQPFLVARKTS
jgi:20S proteasome alpha/beta subunit